MMLLEIARVKEEAEREAWELREEGAECARVKEEPASEWHDAASSPRAEEAGGVSAAAGRAGLYAGHDVKGELVLGPECLQPPDTAFALPPSTKNTPDQNSSTKVSVKSVHTPVGCRAQLWLRACSVRLERLTNDKESVNQIIMKTVLNRQSHCENKMKKVPEAFAASRQPHNCDTVEPKNAEVVTVTACGDNEGRSPAERSRACRGEQLGLRALSVRLARLPAAAHRDHTGRGLYCCDACGEQFARKRGLIVHVRLHSTGVERVKDVTEENTKENLKKQPKRSSENKLSIKPQTRFDIENNKSKCNKYKILRELFSQKHDSVEHESTHTGQKPFKCSICLKDFANKYNLISHERIHTGEKPFKCEVCMKQFAHKFTLVEHKRIHNGEHLFKCEICLKQFAYKRAFCQHKRVHSKEKPFKCDICSKQFAVKSSLRAHERLHTGENPYKCDYCSKEYTSKKVLIKHIQMHSVEKHFNCDKCLKQFRLISQLITHKKVHNREEPFKCKTCMKRFAHITPFVKHQQIHPGEKLFQCEICSKRFTRRDNLKEHALLHTEERPHKCDICLKQFRNKNSISKHLKIHAGVKPFKCQFCFKRFTKKSSLTEHERIHTGKKPYECDVCSRRFTQLSAMKGHRRRRHARSQSAREVI